MAKNTRARTTHRNPLAAFAVAYSGDSGRSFTASSGTVAASGEPAGAGAAPGMGSVVMAGRIRHRHSLPQFRPSAACSTRAGDNPPQNGAHSDARVYGAAAPLLDHLQQTRVLV